MYTEHISYHCDSVNLAQMVQQPRMELDVPYLQAMQK